MLLILRCQVLVDYSGKQHDSDKQGLQKKIEKVYKKIPNTSGLIKKTDYNTKITELENKIPSVTGLVTSALIQKPQIEKYLILLFWLPKLL